MKKDCSIIKDFLYLNVYNHRKLKQKRIEVEEITSKLFKYYLENTSEIFMIWNGGMSFHGGLIGVIIAVFFYSKKHRFGSVMSLR